MSLKDWPPFSPGRVVKPAPLAWWEIPPAIAAALLIAVVGVFALIVHVTAWALRCGRR